jgi:hypothetical protein
MLKLRFAALALVVLLVASGCASKASTSLQGSWSAPGANAERFKRILILTVASDEIAQQEFQQIFAARLKQANVNATASHRYFTHRSPAEEARFTRAIESAQADGVLLARVVGVDVAGQSAPWMTDKGPSNLGDMTLSQAWQQAFDPIYSDRSLANSERRDVLIDTVLYQVSTRKAVWSARTITRHAEAGDLRPAIEQFVDVLMNAMSRDGVI